MSDPTSAYGQLDRYDVPTAMLAAPGVPLVDLIGEQGAASVDDIMGPPPTHGWRVIAGDLATPEAEELMLAAPWLNRDPTTWMLLSMSQLDGQWYACINGTGTRVRPGRAKRGLG